MCPKSKKEHALFERIGEGLEQISAFYSAFVLTLKGGVCPTIFLSENTDVDQYIHSQNATG